MIIADDKIANAIAKLHANDAPLEANLLEVVTDFLKLKQIHAIDVQNFRSAVLDVVHEMNEYHRKQIALDE